MSISDNIIFLLSKPSGVNWNETSGNLPWVHFITVRYTGSGSKGRKSQLEKTLVPLKTHQKDGRIWTAQRPRNTTGGRLELMILISHSSACPEANKDLENNRYSCHMINIPTADLQSLTSESFFGGGGRHAAFAEGSTAYIGANLAPEKTPPVQPTKEFSRIRAHAILLRPLPL